MVLATLTLTLSLVLAQDSPPTESLYESATRGRAGSKPTPSTPKPSPTAQPSENSSSAELPSPLDPKNDPGGHARPVDFGDSSR